MYCRKCGKEIPDDSSFCPHCAAPTSDKEPIRINVSGGQTVNVKFGSDRPAPPVKNKWIAMLLVLFTGGVGGHRYYLGLYKTAIVWTLTGGLFGIGWLADIIMLALDNINDGWGRPLSKGEDGTLTKDVFFWIISVPLIVSGVYGTVTGVASGGWVTAVPLFVFALFMPPVYKKLRMNPVVHVVSTIVLFFVVMFLTVLIGTLTGVYS